MACGGGADEDHLIKEVEVEWILSNRKSGTEELSGRDKSREALGFSVWPPPLFSESLFPAHSRQNNVLRITDMCPAHISKLSGFSFYLLQ